ncbi:MAG: Uma2 family endonuclease [Pseudanabaena sp.]
MVRTLIKEPVQAAIGEKRVTLNCDSWAEYQRIAQALGDRPVRLTFDGIRLEIVMPLELHEFARAMIEVFVRVLVMEFDFNLKTMGSTTLAREDLIRGAEPDNAYYIQNQPVVKGRDVDLSQDPPPDLVVEVDITHTDIKKLELYAALGVPEFWRYDGQVWRIYALENGAYRELENSPTFQNVPKLWLYEFLMSAREDELGAMRELQRRVKAILN